MSFKQVKDKYGNLVWKYDIRVKGKRYRKSDFSTRQKAETAASLVRIRATERAAGLVVDTSRVTVAEILKGHLKRLPVPKGSRGYESRLQAARDINRFLKMIPADLLATELKTAHLTQYQDNRLPGRSYDTVFREITNIVTPLNSAWERFPSLENWRPPKRPTADKPKGGKRGRQAVYKPNDFARLIQYLRRPSEGKEHPLILQARISAADALQLAVATAGRAKEVRTRRWADIQWDTGKMRVDDFKQNSEDWTILSDEAMTMLRRRKSEQNPQSEFIFPSAKDRTRPVRQLPVQIIRRAAQHLGIEWGYDSPNGVVFHTARHTATTAMLASGVDMATVQSQTRHSDRSMAQRYGHATDHSRRLAAAAVARIAFSDVSVISPTLTTPITDIEEYRETKKQETSQKKGKKARKPALERATRLELATLSLGTRSKSNGLKQKQLRKRIK